MFNNIDAPELYVIIPENENYLEMLKRDIFHNIEMLPAYMMVKEKQLDKQFFGYFFAISLIFA